MKKLLIIAVVALTGLYTSANERRERIEDRRDERRERIEDRRDERLERREDRRPGWGGIFRPRPIFRPVTRTCASVFTGRTQRQRRFRAVATGRRGTGVKRRACRKALRKCRANYPRRARLCVVR